MKRLLTLLILISGCLNLTARSGPWSAERAWEWYRQQPWIRGCNYMSADCYPFFQQEGVGCTMWGFVAGKYQTCEPWESMWKEVVNGEWENDPRMPRNMASVIAAERHLKSPLF